MEPHPGRQSYLFHFTTFCAPKAAELLADSSSSIARRADSRCTTCGARGTPLDPPANPAAKSLTDAEKAQGTGVLNRVRLFTVSRLSNEPAIHGGSFRTPLVFGDRARRTITPRTARGGGGRGDPSPNCVP